MCGLRHFGSATRVQQGADGKRRVCPRGSSPSRGRLPMCRVSERRMPCRGSVRGYGGTGVASGTVMGPSRHLTGSFPVLFEGVPATRSTSMSLQNSTNAPGAQLVPSQPFVLLRAP
jgi:hypothetical protein